ncbi:MAG TPA: sigma 54-interacting transcriptional regulator [Gammaproteobacteria bacterium]|nr:sigma 54-interacting transcriptional regulator [Gammaproteobacteria bacterium]
MTDEIASKPTCEQIIDILPDPFVVIDRDYHIVAANRSYRERYGTGLGDVVGKRCYEVSHHSQVPCSRNGEHCPLEETLRSRQATQVMHVHYDGSGHPEYVQLHGTPLLDEAGEVRYMGEYIYPVDMPRHDDGAHLVGRSRALLRVTSLLQRVAPTQTTVLFLGESGVGKEEVAKYVHHYSRRAGGPFVVVDCGVLGEQLIESELFGYERGAFTGADRRKKGLFETAHGGTLFIDEIGELPLALQSKLLRALESGQIRRVGGTEYIDVDVRVLAATNRDLQAMVDGGEFRSDLYYRLSAFPVRVPPLRERKDDIAALAEYFLSRLEDSEHHVPLSSAVIERLMEYDYPGNVRELRNIVERAAILAATDAIQADHLVLDGAGPGGAGPPPAAAHPGRWLDRRGARLESDEVLRVLDQCRGHRRQAAEVLGVSERTLYRYLKRMRPGADGEG